jgi:hypothetical protein
MVLPEFLWQMPSLKGRPGLGKRWQDGSERFADGGVGMLGCGTGDAHSPHEASAPKTLLDDTIRCTCSWRKQLSVIVVLRQTLLPRSILREYFIA